MQEISSKKEKTLICETGYKEFFWCCSCWNFLIIPNKYEILFKFQKQPPKLFYKKGFLKIFEKFTEKHLCQSPLFNNVAGLQLYQKRDSGTGVSLSNLRKLKNTFFTEHLQTTVSKTLALNLVLGRKHRKQSLQKRWSIPLKIS